MSPLFLHAAQLRGKRVAATPVRVRLELRAKLPASPISMLLSVTPIYVKKWNQLYDVLCSMTDIKIEIVLLMAVNDITWKIAHATVKKERCWICHVVYVFIGKSHRQVTAADLVSHVLQSFIYTPHASCTQRGHHEMLSGPVFYITY
ncbi:hypothetical protein OUZ56_022844 [Daphnia magna]|uniref:Uncharacterized protein n=1 Tax=Daphnia magna TaxID=35525 RepID=A0ABR0AXN0_9CRUS|nr:hypothetical protein OUZ56_022844 [Daphnia magna]